MQLNAILNEIESGNESSDLITGYMDLFRSVSKGNRRRNRPVKYINSEEEDKDERKNNANSCHGSCCECCCDCGSWGLLSSCRKEDGGGCDGHDCCCCDCDCNCCE